MGVVYEGVGEFWDGCVSLFGGHGMGLLGLVHPNFQRVGGRNSPNRG